MNIQEPTAITLDGFFAELKPLDDERKRLDAQIIVGGQEPPKMKASMLEVVFGEPGPGQISPADYKKAYGEHVAMLRDIAANLKSSAAPHQRCDNHTHQKGAASSSVQANRPKTATELLLEARGCKSLGELAKLPGNKSRVATGLLR